MKSLFRSLAALVAAVSIVCPSLAAEAAGFMLVQSRTGKSFGPFEARQGYIARIGSTEYRIGIEGNSRLVFVNVATGREFGPLDFVAGRMVEINGALYTLREASPALRTESTYAPQARIASNTEIVRNTHEGDYAPPPVPPPVVSEIDAMAGQSRTIAKHPDFPSADPGLCVYGWIDPVHVIPYKWEVGGKKAKKASLDYFSVGANSIWNGWTFDFSLIGGAGTGSIVQSGLAVDSASLDDGSGFSVGGGYSHPFMRNGPWEIDGGVRVFYTSLGMDMDGRAMTTYATTTATNIFGEVSTSEQKKYASSKTSADFTEWGVWLDFGATRTYDAWLFKGGVSIAPFTDAEVDAKLHGGSTDYSIKASRQFPLSGWLGAEWGLDSWRYSATITFGSDNMIRLGALYVF